MTGSNPDKPALIATVDVVVLTVEDDELKVLLHRRPRAPYEGVLALPGGYIRPDEDASTTKTAERILRDKAGVENIYFEQLSVFSGMTRDPRGWSLSVAHLALVPRELLTLTDDPDVVLVDVETLPPLAFDHEVIMQAALERLRGKGAYSTLPASFLPEKFTLSQLRKAYEVALGHPIERMSFRRKLMDLEMIEETGETSTVSSRRPAMLYRLKDGVSTFNRTLSSA